MRPAASAPRPTSMSTSPSASPPAAAGTPTSPWHSPVPYLFGGLAAMLGLITLALLILACSYWKLNSYLGTGDDSSGAGAGDADGSKSPAAAAAASPAAFADLVAVVMAGEKTPTFLAAPIVHRAGKDTAAAAVEGSRETEEEKNRGKAWEGESGAVADAERVRQQDHV
ncbi:protein GLUTAMINE DUMPER 1-like [Phragmites australis]|uniref:protein GLUTAMINE DUMPER 1-like n=1 Tax=Phragmites australis TaxID=29695 RepID=UPI002D796283|nr:protein GLUTAMINE DUMPER 1-like [Phragmites australis]